MPCVSWKGTTALVRIASCSCGALKLECRGEPVRLSMCHCRACQRRTGAPFGAQARFPRAAVTATGASKRWLRIGDSGLPVTYHFCPECGSNVYWELGAFPDLIAVAIGGFADPGFPAPRISVYERTRHPWTRDIAACEMQHED